MAFNTGDITEITATHPTLPPLNLQVKKGTDFSYSLGGVRTLDNDDGISGAGEPIYIMENNPWFIEGSILWDMNSRDELDLLSKYSASIEEAQWTINCINTVVHGGTGKPVGDLTGTNKGEIPLKIAGGGKLEKLG